MTINLDDNTTRLVLAAIAVIGSGAMISWRYVKKNSSKNNVRQNNNVAGGDITGRDKITKN